MESGDIGRDREKNQFREYMAAISNDNPVKQMSGQYTRILVTSTVVLLVIIFGLLINQYLSHRQHELTLAQEYTAERAVELDFVLKTAAYHVKSMQLWGEKYLTDTNKNPAASPLSKKLRYFRDGDYFSLDKFPPKPEDEHGNLFGTGPLENRSPDIVREQNMALWLLELMRITHRETPYFAWSFYSSANNFAASYPWVTAEFMINQTPDKKLSQVFEHVYGNEQWRALIPERNPGRKNIWLDAYVDASGKGLVVTNASPVYDGDKFTGAVAADIQLTFLQRFVESIEQPHSRIFIVDRRNQVLARTGVNTSQMKEIAGLDNVLPRHMLQAVRTMISKNKQATRTLGGYKVIVQPVTETGWTMVHIIPEKDFLLGFARPAASYILIIVALIVFLLFANRSIHGYFVGPAIKFVDFIRLELQKGPVPAPDLPPLWKHWVARVSDALQFKAISGNLPGALFQAVRHGDGTFTMPFVSDGVSRILDLEPEDFTRAQGLRLDLLPEAFSRDIVPLIEASGRNMTPFEFESPIRAGDQEKWVRFVALPRRGDNGDILWDGMMLDISERKAAELALEKHRDELEDTVKERTRELEESIKKLHHEIAMRIQTEKELVEKDRRLGKLTQEVISSQEKERLRLARELHDDLGQQLTAILFGMIALREKNRLTLPDIERFQGMLKQVSEDLRAICKGLNPVMLDRLGLDAAIANLVDDVAADTDIQVEKDICTLTHKVPENAGMSAYRICQEALSNVLRHAGATKVTVSLHEKTEGMELCIEDNGCGFDRDNDNITRGIGLVNMSQRAELCGGSLHVESRAGQGTVVRVAIPWKEEPES